MKSQQRGKHLNQKEVSQVTKQNWLVVVVLIIVLVLVGRELLIGNDTPEKALKRNSDQTQPEPSTNQNSVAVAAPNSEPMPESDQELDGMSDKEDSDSNQMPKSDRGSKKMKAKSDRGMKKTGQSKMKDRDRGGMNRMPKCGKMGRVTPAMLRPHQACGKQIMHLRDINRRLPGRAQISTQRLVVRRVREGECLSCITERSLRMQLKHQPSDKLVGEIWRHLYKLNKTHNPPLLRSNNPNLIYKGEYITVPIAIRDV